MVAAAVVRAAEEAVVEVEAARVETVAAAAVERPECSRE